MKPRVVLIIGTVRDVESQVRFQRVLALAERFELYVVTVAPLPPSLRELVAEELILEGVWTTWVGVASLIRRLQGSGAVVIHTVYAPRPVLVGFLARSLYRVCWVYDLFDHPSLTWSRDRIARRLLKRAVWALGSRLIRHANYWIIGMHPAVLSYLPVPRRECRLVFTGPGTSATRKRRPEAAMLGSKPTICYSGPVSAERGAALLVQWIKSYEGPAARLHLIGQATVESRRQLDKVIPLSADRGLEVIRHGRLPYGEAVDLVRTSDIGICLLDPNILNYRFAYPIKLVEYLREGVIPVATESYGTRELIRDGWNGFISSYDVTSFSRKMQIAIESLSNTGKRRELVGNAISSVRKRSWAEVNERWIEQVEFGS